LGVCDGPGVCLGNRKLPLIPSAVATCRASY
jgi:hypothetical protein